MQDTPVRQRRHWADVVVILVGLALAGLAIWPPPFGSTPEGASVQSSWWVYAAAGGLSLAALFIGQRWSWRTLARVLLGLAAAALVFGFVTAFYRAGPVAWLTTIVPAVLLLLAIPFFGPMPGPPERQGLGGPRSGAAVPKR